MFLHRLRRCARYGFRFPGVQSRSGIYVGRGTPNTCAERRRLAPAPARPLITAYFARCDRCGVSGDNSETPPLRMAHCSGDWRLGRFWFAPGHTGRVADMYQGGCAHLYATRVRWRRITAARLKRPGISADSPI